MGDICKKSQGQFSSLLGFDQDNRVMYVYPLNQGNLDRRATLPKEGMGWIWLPSSAKFQSCRKPSISKHEHQVAESNRDDDMGTVSYHLKKRQSHGSNPSCFSTKEVVSKTVRRTSDLEDVDLVAVQSEYQVARNVEKDCSSLPTQSISRCATPFSMLRKTISEGVQTRAASLESPHSSSDHNQSPKSNTSKHQSTKVSDCCHRPANIADLDRTEGHLGAFQTFHDPIDERTPALRGVGDGVEIFQARGLMSQTIRPSLKRLRQATNPRGRDITTHSLLSSSLLSIPGELACSETIRISCSDKRASSCQVYSRLSCDEETDVDSTFGEELERFGRVPYELIYDDEH